MQNQPLHRTLMALGTLATAIALGACSTSGGTTGATAGAQQHVLAETASTEMADGKAPVLDVTALDFGYRINTPTPTAAGLVTVRLHNTGSEPHQATIVRLHDGVTPEQFGTAMRTDPGAALALVDFVGGVNAIAPGAVGAVSSRLTDGNYLLLCFVQGADHVPHVAKGMVAAFAVSGPGHGRTAHADGTVRLRSYGFEFPPGFGHGTYAVTNTGDEPHELAILRVAPKKTTAEVETYLRTPQPVGPPPFTYAGGVATLSPGRTSYGDFHLAAGDYVAVCFVPDDQTHMPHSLMGMLRPFHVS